MKIAFLISLPRSRLHESRVMYILTAVKCINLGLSASSQRSVRNTILDIS
jgi:hypothetical protein